MSSCSDYNKKYYQQNKESLDKTNKAWRDRNPEKVAEYQRNWLKLKGNKEKVRLRKQKYRETNREKVRKYQQQYNAREVNKKRAEDLRLRRRFSISLEEVDSLLIHQGHICPICKKSLKETERVVDHDHKTGKVRGILCRNCNSGIGLLGDNPEVLIRAMGYLNNL